MLSLILIACTGGDDESSSDAHAPFSLEGASAYWVTQPGYYNSLAVLIISKEADCQTVSEQYLFSDLDAELFEGEGLLFLMQQETWGSENDGTDFTGLWMGAGFSDSIERNMSTIAYSRGLLYILEWGYSWYYGDASSWVNVDSQDGTVAGRFYTDMWQGDFVAEDCGSWDSGWYPDDTYWDSDWYPDDTDWDSDWDSDWDDTGCGDYSGSTYIGIDESNCSYPSANQAIAVDCDSSDRWADVYTVGWSGGADLELTDGDRAESHPMGSYDYDSDGWWDNLYAQLAIVESPDDVVDGAKTAFACSVDLSWRITVYDTEDGEADCAVGGKDPGSFSSDCTVWE